MESSEEKGMGVFLDVFRRADKNDDSALSWDEFRSFFADGVMSEEELRKLFHEIDTHNTNNIDTEELCTYFSQHLGPFKNIFRGIEDMNGYVSNALSCSAQGYSKASHVEQFTTRFLLREITNQLAALQRPLDAAADVLDEKELESSTNGETMQSCPAAALLETGATSKPPVFIDAESSDQVVKGSITPGRVARRARKQFSTQTSWTTEAGLGVTPGALNQQVDRLRSLLDRLENKVNLGPRSEEEHVDLEHDDLMVIVSRRLQVEDGHDKAFRNGLRNYIESVNTLEECLSIGVRSYTGSPLICIYEVWKSPQDWNQFCVSATSKSFRHSNVDHLACPEQMTSIKLPGNWWDAQ